MRHISRKSFVSIPVLTGTAWFATGCNSDSDDQSGDSATASVKASPQSTGSHGGTILNSAWRGVELSIEVGPAVVKGDHTVVRLSLLISAEAKDPSEPFGLSQLFSEGTNSSTMLGLRMLDLEKGLIYPQLRGKSITAPGNLSKTAAVEIFPVFSAVGKDTHIVQLFLPSVGIVSVPVVAESGIHYSVDNALKNAEFVDTDPGPFKLVSLIEAPDGNVDTKQDEKSTTVTVAGDVTFATDSDQLSAQADSVLASVVEQVKKYPSGGDLTITGHTDDVADDAHNQDLSERRAKAVSGRLKKLVDLSAWKESVSGKGESSPRVPNDSDEHRQANRRVEISLKPKNAQEGESAQDASATPTAVALPDQSGPTGEGPEGIDLKLDNGTVHISLDHVVRIGRFLAGTLLLKVDHEISLPAWTFALPSSMQDKHWPYATHAVSSLTILHRNSYYLEAGYPLSTETDVPLSNNFMYTLHPGAPTRLPAVWPDTGTDSVTLDVPGGDNRFVPKRVAFRLTGIPVVES